MPSNLINVIFHYFTFFAGAINLFNLWTVRNKASSFMKIFLALFSVQFFVWGILQALGGYSTFLFVLLPPNNHPVVAIFWAIYFISLWGSTVWIVWGNGDDELLKSGLVYGKEILKSPQIIKLFFVITSILFPLLVVLGFASGFFSKAVTELQIH